MTDHQAGRELDALIHNKVMGIHHDFAGCQWCQRDIVAADPYVRGNPHFQHYSTDIAAAWQVVEKLREKSDGHFTLLGFTTNWRASWKTPAERSHIVNMCYANTAPLAICRAALKAVEKP